MLKNYVYDGAYRDERMSISVMLENPLEYGLEANTLAFGITLQAKDQEARIPKLEDFTFYIMDEANRLYNTQKVSFLQSDAEVVVYYDGVVYKPDGLITIGFECYFLFQNLRIAFFHRDYNNIQIISMKH